MIKFYNREKNKIEEEMEYKKELLHFLYKTLIGRFLLKTIVARPWFSKLKAKYQKSQKSKKDIKPFVNKYNIDISKWNINEFNSFNDFFIRKKNIENISKNNELVAIADSKLSVLKIEKDTKLNIKNSTYSLEDIIQDKELADEYSNGFCLVFRLAMDDYHRYVFLDNGNTIKHYKIKGLLHTIRPISNKYKVYSQNTREITILNTNNFGKIVQIEVGAMLVGKINNHKVKNFKKLQEKGYFEYGGSTIVLLLKNNIKIDDDIIMYSKKNIETKVSIGERIGVLK